MPDEPDSALCVIECISSALYALIQAHGGQVCIPIERLPCRRYRFVPALHEDGSLEMSIQMDEALN